MKGWIDQILAARNRDVAGQRLPGLFLLRVDSPILSCLKIGEQRGLGRWPVSDPCLGLLHYVNRKPWRELSVFARQWNLQG